MIPSWKRIEELTSGVVRTTDDVRGLLTNLKPRSVKSSSSFSEVSYPHPRREFKLLKSEEVYNFDVMKFKRRYLKKNKLQFASDYNFFWNDIRAVGLCNQINERLK